jgi:DNA-binding NtrC family response regulator
MSTMARTPSGRPPSREAAGVTVQTAQQARAREGTARAVYVTGPNGGSRHLLPDGLVRLGRGPESTIIVDDPLVSRSHAALHVGTDLMLSDLGSVNGTFLGTERLRPGEARPLAVGQAFFLGDSALVVRATSLETTCAKRVAGLEHVREKFLARGAQSCMVVVKVRPLRPTRASQLETILGELLESPTDWMWWAGVDQVFLGMAGESAADVARSERVVVRQLVSWSALADVESKLVGFADFERAGEGLRGLFESDTATVLGRADIVIRDPAMSVLHHTIARVAPAPVNVLVLGETGVGKEVIASMVHELSTRAQKPFVRLNCASLPEALLESELFGFERGAFTGAVASKAGLLESADGGTVFLDEVGELPLAVQAKILRALESGEVMRLGTVKPRRIDVRFVAATNRDLTTDVARRRFRQDLYYRLNGVTLNVPPLRERPSEIEPLARLFLRSACSRFGTPEPTLSGAALEALARYAWPGNARELRNVIERTVLLTPEPVIEPTHLGLPSPDSRARAQANGSTGPLGAATEVPTADPERERLLQALSQCGGNQSRAAELLGIPRRTLVRQIARLGLPRPRETGPNGRDR